LTEFEQRVGARGRTGLGGEVWGRRGQQRYGLGVGGERDAPGTRRRDAYATGGLGGSLAGIGQEKAVGSGIGGQADGVRVTGNCLRQPPRFVKAMAPQGKQQDDLLDGAKGSQAAGGCSFGEHGLR